MIFQFPLAKVSRVFGRLQFYLAAPLQFIFLILFIICSRGVVQSLCIAQQKAMELMSLYVSVTLFILTDEIVTACEESLYLPSALVFKTSTAQPRTISISKWRSKQSIYREFSKSSDCFKYNLLKVMETTKPKFLPVQHPMMLLGFGRCLES